MTPYQGTPPTDPQGRRPSGSEYRRPPTRQPQQPQSGQVQGQPQRQPNQSQPMQQQQQAMPQGGTGPTQQRAGVAPPGAQPQGVQQQPTGGMQPAAAGQGQQAEARRGGPRMRPVSVEEIVQTDVVTVQRNTPIATAVAKMAEENVGSVVVVESDRPVGVLTDRKIALALENTPDVADKQAAELIGGDLITGTTDMTVFDALQQLSDEGIRRLPIVDDDGTLRGIVTLDDVLVLLGSELDKVGETIRAQSPRL